MSNFRILFRKGVTMQLDFFENTDIFLIKEEVKKVRTSSEKVRKSLFAKHSELYGKMIELQERLLIIEQNICKNRES